MSTTQKGGENLSRKERKDIKAMVEAAVMLAEKDPQGFMIIKSNIEVLKARSDMDRALVAAKT